MREFKSWRSYDAFQNAALRNFRYLRDPEHDEFLETLVETAQSRTTTLKEGTILWRAQRGHDWRDERQGGEVFQIPAAHPAKRMKPLKNRAREGRANPKGIAFLYLATGTRTALSEVRPWVGTYVSIAQFKLLRQQTVVDCSKNVERRNLAFFLEEPKDAAQREGAVWADIDRAFASPVEDSDDEAEYVPTQILAELFRKRGFDGIAYRSNFTSENGASHNIALFDLSAADVINCGLHRVDTVKCEFSQSDDTYFVSKYYEATRLANKATRRRIKRKVV